MLKWRAAEIRIERFMAIGFVYPVNGRTPDPPRNCPILIGYDASTSADYWATNSVIALGLKGSCASLKRGDLETSQLLNIRINVLDRK